MTGIARPDGSIARLTTMAVAGAGGTLTEIAEAWVWDEGRWRPVWSGIFPLDGMGMDKAGDMAIGTNMSGVRLTGWTPRAGFPDTVITGDGIAVPPGVTVDVTGRVTLAAPAGSAGYQAAALVVGGAVVVQAGTTGTVIDLKTTRWTNTTTTPAVLGVNVVRFAAAPANTVLGGPSTYLTVTRV